MPVIIVDQNDELDHDESICHCGTMKEAFEVADKLMADATAHNCPAWAMQVGYAMMLLSKGVFVMWSVAGNNGSMVVPEDVLKAELAYDSLRTKMVSYASSNGIPEMFHRRVEAAIYEKGN